MTFVLGQRIAIAILGICAAVATAALPPPVEAPGACINDDDAFNSEEGGCLDFRSGVAWGLRRGQKGSHTEGKLYCHDLQEAGFHDWRLPTRTEMSAAAGLTRAKSHFAFPLVGPFWSDTGNEASAYVVDLETGYRDIKNRRTFQAGILCVRKGPDVDGDGVPDSSDVCNHSPHGAKVETVGDRKGCGERDYPMAANVGCKEDDTRFQTALGGCRDVRTHIVWGARSKDTVRMFEAERYCEDYREALGGTIFDRWHLPTQRELESVVGEDVAGRHLKLDTSAYYWSSTIIDEYRHGPNGAGETLNIRPRLALRLVDGLVEKVATQGIPSATPPYIILPMNLNERRWLVCVRSDDF